MVRVVDHAQPGPVSADGTKQRMGKATQGSVSVPSPLGSAGSLSRPEQGRCDYIQAAGQAAGQEDPTSEGHGAAEGRSCHGWTTVAADAPEALPWDQLDNFRRPTWAHPPRSPSAPLSPSP